MRRLFILGVLFMAPAAWAQGLTPSGPITLTSQNGTVINHLHVTNPSGDCITVTTSTNITIKQSEIGPCGGNAIKISGGGTINIYDSYIHPGTPLVTTCCDTHDGIFASGTTTLTIQGNVIAYGESNIEVSGSAGVTVTGNLLLNPIDSNPGAPPNTQSRGQNFQAWSGSSNITVQDNYALSSTDTTKYTFAENQEDSINFGLTTGIVAQRNYITGGHSPSGCGIIADDSANSAQFLHNNLLDTGQCGLSIADGTNQLMDSNKVLNRTPVNGAGNTAISVWKQYTNPCGPVTSSNNIASAIQFNGTPNSLFNGGGCTPFTETNDTLDAAAAAALNPPSTTMPPPRIPPIPHDCAVVSPYTNSPVGSCNSVANSITITWSAPSGPLTAYTVYRSTVHGGPYAAIASGITSLIYTDSGLTSGTYYYVITSFNGGVVTNITGNGTTATVTCAASCSFPSGSTVIIHGNSFLDGTFTSTGQPSGTTFTFASSSSGSGTAGGAWQSGAESNNSNESGAAEPIVRSVSFTPASLTFPSTNTGSSAPTQSITANNTSSLGANLTISNLAFTGTNPGDFSTTLGCVGTVAPAGSCVATVTFTPTAAGARSASLTFTDNAAGSPQSVPVSGTGASGAPAVTFLPTSLNFGQQIISTSSVARSIQVTNSGSAILVVSGITFTGTNAADYSETDNCTSVSVGASCTINVTFTPSASGTRIASVNVADNVAGSPQLIPLTGVGATVQCSLAGSAALGGVASICQ